MRVRCVLLARDRRSHYAVWDLFGKRGEAWGYVIPDGKANTRDMWFGLCFATQEEGVACSHFFHTACVCPSGFAECSYGDVVPSQLVANDCCHALRTAVSVHEGPHIPGTEIDFGFVCRSFPSGFVCLSFSNAEVDVQPAAASWQDRGEASFVWATFSRPFPREGGAVHSLNRAAPSSRAAAESPCCLMSGGDDHLALAAWMQACG